jgi:hypothetical protein
MASTIAACSVGTLLESESLATQVFPLGLNVVNIVFLFLAEDLKITDKT